MRRRLIAIAVLGLLLALLGSATWTTRRMKGRQTSVVIMENTPQERLKGDWYTTDGFLDLVVVAPRHGEARVLVRPESWAGSCEATSVRAMEDGLEFDCQGGKGDALRLRLWRAEGSDAILNWHNYWLYREPSWVWLVERWWPRAFREVEDRTVDTF